MRLAVPFLVVLGCLACGCGARTPLRDPGPSVTSAHSDAGTGRRDAPVTPTGCTRDAECDDGLSCTRDRCGGGVCVVTPDDAACGDDFCSLAVCDPSAPGASPTTGCAAMGARSCADEVDCTVDACDPDLRVCDNLPDNSLCPLSFRCDAVRGCQARALVHATESVTGGMEGFGEMDLPSGVTRWIGVFDHPMDDIALAGDGTFYGAGTGGGLFVIDETTGTTTTVTLGGDSVVGLDFSPTGELYGAIDEAVVILDRRTGLQTRVATFPPDVRASGDVGFVGAVLYVTARPRLGALPADVLFSLDASSGSLRRIGSTGHPCVWGLAPLGSVLYGTTCQGRLIRIDLATGAGELLAEPSPGTRFQGAAAR